MRLLLLHGPPASGKLTIARELAAQTGWRLFHNHLVVNAVGALFEFGTPAFVELREATWRALLGRAVAEGVDTIFTFCPERSVGQPFVDWLATLPVYSVALVTDEAELEHRMAAASRRAEDKLTDPALYRTLRDAGVFAAPRMPPADLTLRTESLTPAEAARAIADAVAAQTCE